MSLSADLKAISDALEQAGRTGYTVSVVQLRRLSADAMDLEARYEGTLAFVMRCLNDGRASDALDFVVARQKEWDQGYGSR